MVGVCVQELKCQCQCHPESLTSFLLFRYEIGLYTGLMMDYAQVTQDNQFSNKIVNLMTAQSYGTVGNFLGSNPSIAEFGGKWNDDLVRVNLIDLLAN